MCQCLPCDCCWWNFCGTCGGCAELMCCLGWWCCQPDELKRALARDVCCLCCESSGYGGNCCCYGVVCCAPQWLQTYSKTLSGAQK